MMSTGEESWVKRLEVPLIKLGVQDEAVFNNKEHVARQAVNRLALLEMMAHEQAENESTRESLDNIVRVINDEFDGTPMAFEKAMPEIRSLFDAQQEIYQANLDDVLNESEDLEAICNKSNRPKQNDDNFRLTREGEEWLKKVNRLQPGDWMEFTIGQEIKRAKLAWHGECTKRFVFVNAIGRKELAYGSEQLAMDVAWPGQAHGQPGRPGHGSGSILDSAENA
jgi:hypothetical protein